MIFVGCAESSCKRQLGRHLANRGGVRQVALLGSHRESAASVVVALDGVIGCVGGPPGDDDPCTGMWRRGLHDAPSVMCMGGCSRVMEALAGSFKLGPAQFLERFDGHRACCCAVLEVGKAI